jgi:hypothetical protein
MGGTLPVEIYQLTALRQLILVENSFSGTISGLIANLSELSEYFLLLIRRRLRPQSNPHFLLAMILLAVELALDLNQLSGTLTTEFQASTNLASLDLANNYFFGNFNSIFAGMDKLGTIYFNCISFASIISQLFPFLVLLSLTSNRITGSLTSDIQQFTNLGKWHFEPLESVSSIYFDIYF